MKNNENPHEDFTAFLFGKVHSDNLKKLYEYLLVLESEEDFFNEKNELSPYLLISYHPDDFDLKYRDDLPKNIQEKITIIADKIFKK